MTFNIEKINNVYIEFDKDGNVVIKQREESIINKINNIIDNEPEEGPYECTICNKSFVKKSYWKRHVLSHNGKFACEKCDREFSHHHHLNQHMRVHREREYACDICGMKIRFKFNIKKHRATHIPYRDENGNIKYFTSK
jgi:uncharacterized Zn-finger protein